MCVNCMEPSTSLYQRYSEGVIRLSDCVLVFHSHRLERIAYSKSGIVPGNVAVVFSIIFRLSNEFSYRFVTQFFIFISHFQVQRTLYPKLPAAVNFTIVTCGVVASMASGFLCRHLLEY
ncbi:unnamed protein product [Haemonchus placei]|uniref:Protein ARV n=1 Tax=Haemonchus placei TaxID=6290 RepID=A0A158QLR9_HAEPC|nr:unnamed protein product [Haemonchus placei]